MVIIIFLLLSLSERIPPRGLAMRFTKAKDAAIKPALVGVNLNVASKKAGSMETTASSAPKFAKYVVLRAMTLLNLYLSSSGTPFFNMGIFTRNTWIIWYIIIATIAA